MRSTISKTIAFIAISVALFSFSPNRGGEGFEIYLGDKLLTQQFGNKANEVKSLALDHVNANDHLVIKYYHCGRVGNNRVVTVKDEQDKLLKEFHYADQKTAGGMNVPLRDFLGLKKGKTLYLKLYYSSSELPRSRLLASVVTGDPAMARK